MRIVKIDQYTVTIEFDMMDCERLAAALAPPVCSDDSEVVANTLLYHSLFHVLPKAIEGAEFREMEQRKVRPFLVHTGEKSEPGNE